MSSAVRGPFNTATVLPFLPAIQALILLLRFSENFNWIIKQFFSFLLSLAPVGRLPRVHENFVSKLSGPSFAWYKTLNAQPWAIYQNLSTQFYYWRDACWIIEFISRRMNDFSNEYDFDFISFGRSSYTVGLGHLRWRNSRFEFIIVNRLENTSQQPLSHPTRLPFPPPNPCGVSTQFSLDEIPGENNFDKSNQIEIKWQFFFRWMSDPHLTLRHPVICLSRFAVVFIRHAVLYQSTAT